jgi:hypothetical protein
VATDQTDSTTSPKSPPISAIENEFPAYRAISSLSVLSLILGLGSVFCFASPWFLVVVAGSVVAGWVAIRKIRQLPDVLTGTGYARVGIGLGLLFGLTSVTYAVVQEINVHFEAGAFAKNYAEVIKDKPMSLALWYQQRPEYRKTKSPDEIADELKKMKSPSSPDPYGEKTAPIQRMKDRLKGKDETIRFYKVEKQAIIGLDVYANALLEFDGPGSKEFPEKEQFAILQLFKRGGGGADDWEVQEIQFPYTLGTVEPKIEKKDDGHGHGH